MPFVLTIADGKGRGQKFQFDAPKVTIGRGAENDVVLNDGGVSRLHARIEKQGSAWMLLDNGSANGTELNGATIDKPRQLRAGDRIGVGPVTFEFSSAEGGETRITAAPARQSAETRITSMPAEPKEIAPKAGAAAQQKPSIAQTWALMPLPLRLLVIAGAAFIVIGIAVKSMQGQEKR
ncbi:MAG TPA: FHA domain-containing protein, partial [Myxococcales bacterium]|nr:FHA domain-containing protein [Myxococcales bacterium]